MRSLRGRGIGFGGTGIVSRRAVDSSGVDVGCVRLELGSSVALGSWSGICLSRRHRADGGDGGWCASELGAADGMAKCYVERAPSEGLFAAPKAEVDGDSVERFWLGGVGARWRGAKLRVGPANHSGSAEPGGA
ncbi:hypothetical protein L1887_62809 [Cichorium endivia]|nr:hypothetical protein L1887_62809 [Cichorium endivia]